MKGCRRMDFFLCEFDRDWARVYRETEPADWARAGQISVGIPLTSCNADSLSFPSTFSFFSVNLFWSLLDLWWPLGGSFVSISQLFRPTKTYNSINDGMIQYSLKMWPAKVSSTVNQGIACDSHPYSLQIQVHGSYFSLPRKLPDKLLQFSLWPAILMEIRRMEVIKTA